MHNSDDLWHLLHRVADDPSVDLVGLVVARGGELSRLQSFTADSYLTFSLTLLSSGTAAKKLRFQPA